jgi:hypothetical protein
VLRVVLCVPYACPMSILSSLASGFAMHAHGGATVTYSAVMATLTQVLRVVQVLIVCALFYGVVRFFWWFISNATDLPVAPVSARPVIADYSLGTITQACPECSFVSALGVVKPDSGAHSLELWCGECGCVTPLAVTSWETAYAEPVAVVVGAPVVELQRSDNSGFTVCPDCGGTGGSSAYLGDFTMDEMYEHGEDFVEDYFEGRYDRNCEACNGQRVVTACAVVGCESPVVNLSSPWSSETSSTKNCYGHLTPDEDELLTDCTESWSEFRSGC